MPRSDERKIRVLVVDDSPIVRQTVTQVISADRGLEVIGAAPDPFVAVRLMKEHVPDVILLDIEMPRMDGLTFLDRIMSQHPLPVVICSTLTENGSASAIEALQRGAVEVIAKPKLGTRQFLEESAIVLCDALRAAAGVPRHHLVVRAPLRVAPKLSADEVLAAAPASSAMVQTTDKVVVVGASTGGTEALQVLLEGLPLDAPGVAIVQHMPAGFTTQFARRLDGVCRVAVKEAESGDPVLRGHVLLAPGGKHLLLKRSGARYVVEVRDGPLVNRHRPSVDVLFRSSARYAGRNAVGVILTGMGDDGARGMLELKQAGAATIAQDEATSVVYGMPREAVKLGGVDRIVPLPRIAEEVLRLAR